MAHTKQTSAGQNKSGSLFPGGKWPAALEPKKKEPARSPSPPPNPPPPPPPTTKDGRLPKRGRCIPCTAGHRKCDTARPCGRCVHVGRPNLCRDEPGTAPAAAATAPAVMGGTNTMAAQSTNAQDTPAQTTSTAADPRQGGLQYVAPDPNNALPIRTSGGVPANRGVRVPIKKQGTGEDDSSEDEEEGEGDEYVD